MPENPPLILLVDDTESSRYAISRILRQAKFTVQEAATGLEALAWPPPSRTSSCSMSNCPT